MVPVVEPMTVPTDLHPAVLGPQHDVRVNGGPVADVQLRGPGHPFGSGPGAVFGVKVRPLDPVRNVRRSPVSDPGFQRWFHLEHADPDVERCLPGHEHPEHAVRRPGQVRPALVWHDRVHPLHDYLLSLCDKKRKIIITIYVKPVAWIQFFLEGKGLYIMCREEKFSKLCHL